MRRELYGRIVTTTGLTFATRSSRGRVATAEDHRRSRDIALPTTLIAGPVASLAMKRPD